MVLEPLDTIAVRDGRAFDAGINTEAQTMTPTPSTVAGAIGAAYGAAPGAGRADPDARGSVLPERIRGPFVVRRAGSHWQARWPIPRDVVRPQSRRGLIRLHVAYLNEGERTDLGLGAFLDDGGRRVEPVEGWWNTRWLTAYLHDGDVNAGWLEDPWLPERRVGLARNKDRTAMNGMLYSTRHFRLLEGYGLAACCLGGPERDLRGLVHLGGRGRRAEVHQVEEIALPELPPDFPGGRLLLYLATPAVFPGGDWQPSLNRWPGAELVTAATGAPQPVTTVIANRSRVRDGLLMWAVPPGSVYYLRFPDEKVAAEAAAYLYEHGLDQAEEWMRTAGFGTALVGRWA